MAGFELEEMDVADGLIPPAVPGKEASGRRIVTIALLLAMAVVALEQTVVSTAMPSIIAQLKGLDIYPWVFSAYLLASTVTTPIYGKLADLWGRKRILLFGLGPVRDRVGDVGPGALDARADRHAGHPGAGGRGGRADRPDLARRPVHAWRSGRGSRGCSAPSGGSPAWPGPGWADT